MNLYRPLAFLLPLSFSLQLHAQNKLPEIKADAAPLVRTPQNSFAPVVEKVAPSVVTISINEMRRADGRGTVDLDDPTFRWLRDLREQFGGERRRPQADEAAPRQRVEIGVGSGVIISPDGYILTNNHVIEAGDEIVITLADGKTKYTAKKIGGDPETDIAVVKVDATGLPVATFANSDQVKVGDVVLAIGNPFALRQSVSMGIVSATGRRQREMGFPGGVSSQLSNCIQTDAAINPGNSGGALVDAEGRLIGINSSIISRTGGNLGIGFAVPSNQARSVMESLIKFGHAQRGYLGIRDLQDMNEKLAKEFKVPAGGGVVVSDLVDGAPAAKSGVKNGDVILELNGKPIESADKFISSITELPPGTQVKIKVAHKGETRELSIVLGERPPDKNFAGNDLPPSPVAPAPAPEKRPAPAVPAHAPDVLDGMSVSDLRPEYRAQFGIPETVRGALVTEVKPNTPCAEELKAGDVIVEIDDKPVKDADDAVKISEQVKTKTSVRLRVNTRGTTRFVIVEESK